MATLSKKEARNMKVKKKQVELLIEFQESVIARNANSRHPLTDEEQAWRIGIKRQIEALNQAKETR